MNTVTVKDNRFYLGEKPFRIISGAIHYFRVVPEYWEDRLLKLKAGGFNTVETYIPWNLHEPEKGYFRFSGIANIEQFIFLAQKTGLYVVVRPGPYICAEWEGGGLPYWLLQDGTMRVRCCCPQYLDAVRRYYNVLLPRLVPLQATQGGPIIAMQIENEYGSYGNDTEYLQFLKTAMEYAGINVLLFTSDGPTELMLNGGVVSGILPTVNFGSKPEEAFALLKKRYPFIPPVVMEFWNGWFDHWGEQHHTRAACDAVRVFETVLQNDASVNCYMFHGGTNFGFYNGANYGTQYEPAVTSYDYDCLLTEWGTPTPKFFGMQQILCTYTEATAILPPMPPVACRIAPQQQSADGFISLFEALPYLSDPIFASFPLTMEQAGQDYGFILYRTRLLRRDKPANLSLKGLHDRAIIFFNGVLLGTVYRNDAKPHSLYLPAESGVLDILVENMGRINYGHNLLDAKGITKGVYVDYQALFGWHIFPLPLRTQTDMLPDACAYVVSHANPFDLLSIMHTEGIPCGASCSSVQPLEPPPAGYTTEGICCTEKAARSYSVVPAFYRFTLTLEKIGDTFIDMSGWTKGIVFVNNVNIGRYWNIGPQKRLYIPAPFLKIGKNIIIVFELHYTESAAVLFSAEPHLG